MNSKDNLKKLTYFIHELAFDIYKELGPGFKEETFQKALAISFRKNKVEYLKETNIEVFYLGESLGVFRLDFVLLPQKTKSWKLSDSVIIETKVSPSIKNEARLQLKNYLLSLPKNHASSLKKTTEGIILNWCNNLEATDTVEKCNVNIEIWKVTKSKNFITICDN